MQQRTGAQAVVGAAAAAIVFAALSLHCVTRQLTRSHVIIDLSMGKQYIVFTLSYWNNRSYTIHWIKTMFQ